MKKHKSTITYELDNNMILLLKKAVYDAVIFFEQRTNRNLPSDYTKEDISKLAAIVVLLRELFEHGDTAKIVVNKK